jgi:hypothetical protein
VETVEFSFVTVGGIETGKVSSSEGEVETGGVILVTGIEREIRSGQPYQTVDTQVTSASSQER